MSVGTLVALAIVAALLLYAVVVYNGLVALKHNAAKALANINVLLKQRHDELPKLVETCRQYMQYEQQTLERVIAARDQVAAAQQRGDIDAMGRAEGSLRSGLCSVLPQRAEVTPTCRQQWRGNRRHPLKATPEGLPGLLRGVFDAGSRYRYTEERLHDGDWLYLTGWFESTHPPSVEAQATERSKQLLRDWKQDQPQLLARFDRNGDGQIDPSEWEQARHAAAGEAQQQVLRDFDHRQRHTLRAPPTGQPFLISTHDPEQLARRYRKQALFAVIAAAALAAFAGLLLTRG